MAEYINRDKVLVELECGIRAGNYEEGYEKYMHINDMDDCVDTVKYFDSADVVEHTKINRAIEEIENIDLIVHDGINHYYRSGEEIKAEILKILKEI